MSRPMAAMSVDRFHERLEAVERVGALRTLATIAARHGVSAFQVLGQTREPAEARARHELWSLLHGTLGLTPVEIGRIAGRDHSTVLKAIEKRERQLARLHGI